MVADVLRYRQLLLSLTWRDLRVRYHQSWLGIGWAIALPLSMMLIFTFVFTRAIDASAIIATDAPYALYAYTGLVPWTFFSLSLSGCVNSLVANRNLVSKVYFPREVFPLSCIASCLVDFMIAMTVLIGLMAYFHITGGWVWNVTAAWLFLPVVVVVQIALTIGLGMMLAMANLFYRDVRQLLSVGIQLWMFVSAVVVPVPTDGSLLSRLISVNPLVPIISAYRNCVLHNQLPATEPFLYAVVVAVVTLVVGWIVFRRASYKFAECI